MSDAIQEIEGAQPGVSWGICIRIAGEEPQMSSLGETALRTASVGKVLLLITLARLLERGEIEPTELVGNEGVDPVADSGLWQHMDLEALPITDLALLVGTVSDNLATNALIARIGLEAVDETCEELGLAETRLLDIVRDVRTPGDPAAVSEGSALELSGLFEALRQRTRDRDPVSARVVDWLRPGCDLSMVASAFNLDPLAHFSADRGVNLVNKTGTNTEVRADVGFAEGPRRSAAYAAIANWDAHEDHRDAVMEQMRAIGRLIRVAI